MSYRIQGGGLYAEVDTEHATLTVYDAVNNERLLILPSVNLCVPAFGDTTPELTLERWTYEEGRIRLAFTGETCDVRVLLEQTDDALLISSEITLKQAVEMTRLSILPDETAVNLYDVVNFRNRHYTSRTWPELLLGGSGCETDTFSGDWQFAPHPSMIQLRKRETTLCLGALELSTSFGLYFSAADFRVRHCYLDYGKAGHGQKLEAGSVFSSPRFCLFLDRDKTPYETTANYTNLLVKRGLIPDPSTKVRYPWHEEPVYCTWMDQGYVGGHVTPDELGAQQLTGSNPTVEACSEVLVRRILDCCKEQRLPFRTMLIDDGWQISRGEWEVQTDRFPDMRALVDHIHSLGMKVIVWWNWAEVFDDAQVDPAHMAGNGWINRHGRRVRDYSNPRTQQEYLTPLFYKFFSSDPGCYDFDGIKSDFLADKVHPDMPLADESWRGEENYCFRTFQLFYSLMRQHKADACHIGCAGHPYLAESIDINRTYDVATSNYQEHAERTLMLTSSTPGCPVAYDLHNFIERFAEYFESAASQGASVHVGNILGMKQDRFSEWEPADDNFYEIIRQGLSVLGKS